MSWATIARKRSGPIVGRPSTIATIVEPETIDGRSVEMVETIGFSATRKGYFKISRHSPRPFERAVVTYCLLNSSRSCERRMRMVAAVPARPTTMTGTGRCIIRSSHLSSDHGAVRYSGENRPVGVTPKARADMTRRTRARRKLGVASPMMPRKREEIVGNGVLVRRRMQRDRDRDCIDEDEGGERNDDGEKEPVADKRRDGLLPFEGEAEVALRDDRHDPAQILLVERPVEAVALGDVGELRSACRRTRRNRAGSRRSRPSSRRQVDDVEAR